MEEEATKQLASIACEAIVPNPDQPRRHWNLEELEELAASIHAVGLLHPPVVVADATQPGRYQLIAGERRWRAAKLAGLQQIAVVLVTARGGSYRAQAALIENVQRVELNAMEVAEALHKLAEEHHYGQEELAAIVGKKRSTIANYLRLLSQPRSLQQSLAQGEISMGHAKALMGLKGSEQQQLLARVRSEQLSVRKTEELVARSHKGKKKAVKGSIGSSLQNELFLRPLAQQLEQKLHCRIRLVPYERGEAGEIRLEYASLDDLERLLALIG